MAENKKFMTINGRKQQTDLSESHRAFRIQSSFIKGEQSRSTPGKPAPVLGFSLLQKRPKINQFSTLLNFFTWRKIK